jgi:hypothetical protein
VQGVLDRRFASGSTGSRSWFWGGSLKVGLATLATGLVLISSDLANAQGLICDQDRSMQEVRRLTSNHVIVSIDVFMPNVTVVVDDRFWQRSDMAEKKAMAETVDCATGGPNNHMVHSIYFRGSKSNVALADFSGNELTIRSAESR